MIQTLSHEKIHFQPQVTFWTPVQKQLLAFWVLHAIWLMSEVLLEVVFVCMDNDFLSEAALMNPLQSSVLDVWQRLWTIYIA